MKKLNKKAATSFDKVIGIALVVIIATAIIGGLIAVIFGQIGHVADNITAAGAAENDSSNPIGGGSLLAVLFVTVVPILFVIALFVFFRKIIK